ncbi:MAG: hypothetical protein J6T10_06635 [Methanobrevibacter sp.]|nr:hypothetical protein [Methanobrevibacter sp.]
MTKEEYEKICKKYSEFIYTSGDGTGYIRCDAVLKYPRGQYQVCALVWDYDTGETTPTVAKVFTECFIFGKDGVLTKNQPCYRTKDKDEFEKCLLMFIQNYKKILVDIKKNQVEEDFK